MKNKTENNFEICIDRLNNVVKKLESGNISLEETIRLFEEGMILVDQCKNQLKKAELQVSTLLKTQEGFKEKAGI